MIKLLRRLCDSLKRLDRYLQKTAQDDTRLLYHTAPVFSQHMRTVTREWDSYCEDCGHKCSDGSGHKVESPVTCPACESRNIRVRIWTR